jgi:hypothetical protein
MLHKQAHDYFYNALFTVFIQLAKLIAFPGCPWTIYELVVPQEKGGTADNTSRNKICVAHTTQNSHWSKKICLSIKSDIIM